MTTTSKVTSRWINAAQIVAKFNPWNRRYGVRCQNLLNFDNNRVFAGEVGDVRQDTLHGNGWVETVLIADFSHARKVFIARYALTEAGKMEWEFSPGFDPDDFKTISKKNSTVV